MRPLDVVRELAAEACRRSDERAICLELGVARGECCLPCRARYDLATASAKVKLERRLNLSLPALEVLEVAEANAGNRRLGVLDLLEAIGQTASPDSVAAAVLVELVELGVECDLIVPATLAAICGRELRRIHGQAKDESDAQGEGQEPTEAQAEDR